MDIRAERWVEEAEEHAAQGDFAFAVWLVENAIEVSSEEAVRKNAKLTFSISEDDLSKIVTDREKIIARLHKMMDSSEIILQDEWLLLISDISSSYSLQRFINRLSYSIRGHDLEPIVKRLSDVTDGFSLPPFRKQLEAARSRYPNPLPSVIR